MTRFFFNNALSSVNLCKYVIVLVPNSYFERHSIYYDTLDNIPECCLISTKANPNCCLL